MFENQYKTDFHGLISGPTRAPGDFSAVVSAQGSGLFSPNPSAVYLLLWKFIPLLTSAPTVPSVGNSRTGFQSFRQGECHKLN